MSDSVEKLTALLDDKNFIEIASGESKFNIFDALGVRRQELRHSDFLSYLLSPNRPHGLADGFLRDFLIRILPDKFELKYLNPISIRVDNLDKVRVYRERNNLDITIQNPGKWAVIIENKIGAGERDNQTTDYVKKAQGMFEKHELVFLYLTPDGDEASDNRWLSVSYVSINELALLWSNNKYIPMRTGLALADYSDYLEAHVLNNSKIAELCRQVYREHREALDLIAKHSESPRDILKQAVNDTVKKLKEEGLIELDSLLNGMSRFIDTRCISATPNIKDDLNWTVSRYGILMEWIFTSNELRLDLVIGPMENAVREPIIKALQKFDRRYRSSNAKKYDHIHKLPIINFDEINDWQSIEDAGDFCADLRERIMQTLELHHEALRKVLASDGT